MITAQTLFELQKRLYSDSPFYDDAIIAGGAVRDVDHGKQPKDIDIFCLTLGDDDTASMKQWINNCGLFRNGFEVGNGGEYEAPDVKEVHEYQYEDSPVQFIFKDYNQLMGEDPHEDHYNAKARKLVDTFDLGICQAALKWDNENDKVKILKTDLYKQNKQDKTITLVKPVEDEAKREKTKERANRIGRKLAYKVRLDFPQVFEADYTPRIQVDTYDLGLEPYNQMMMEYDNQLRHYRGLRDRQRAQAMQYYAPVQLAQPRNIQPGQQVWVDMNAQFNRNIWRAM